MWTEYRVLRLALLNYVITPNDGKYRIKKLDKEDCSSKREVLTKKTL